MMQWMSCHDRRRRLLTNGIWAAILICLWSAPAVRADDPEGLQSEWGGHLRAVGTIAYPDDQSVYQFVDGGPLMDGQAELRLKNRLFFKPGWSLETHYELVGLKGDSIEKNNQLRTSLPAAVLPEIAGVRTTVSDDRRVFNLTRILVEGDDDYVYHRLDRLNLTHTASWGTVRVGRQALTWGNGLIFNPMDLFNPFSPTAVQRDYKTGEDMLYLQLPIDQGDVQLVYLPRRDPASGDIEDSQSSYAAKWHLPLDTLEIDVMTACHYGDILLSAGSVGDLGGAVWRVDALYTRLDDDVDQRDFWQIVANMDYAWIIYEKNVYGIIEFYYNGLGRDADYAEALTDPQLLLRLERGELFTLGNSYLAGLLRVELHPLVQTALTAIVNLHDPSAVIQPQLTWDLAADWQLIAGANLYRGAADTEFGGFYIRAAGTDIKIAPPDSVYLWLSYYF